MATVAELLVRIGGDSSGLRREINNSQRQLRRAFGTEALELSEGAAGLLGALAVAMGALGVASVSMSSKLNQAHSAFEVLLESGDKATKMVSDLQAYATATSFNFEGLSSTAKGMLAVGIQGQDILPIIASVGDAIGTLGGGTEALQGVIRALSQIQAKGKLSAEEMNQLAERGIPGWKYLAESMGQSTAEVMKMASDGAIDSTTAINAIVGGMATQFKGGAEKANQEMTGQFESMKETATNIMAQIGDSITKALDLKNVFSGLNDSLSRFSSVVQSSGIKTAILGLVPPEATAAVFALGGALVAVAIPALYSFAGTMWLAIAPMAPYIALGAAIGLLAYEIWKNWEPLGDGFSGLWNLVSNRTTLFLNRMQTDFYTAVNYVMGLLSPLASLFGGSFSATINSWANNASNKLNNLADSSADASTKIESNLGVIKNAWNKGSIGLKSLDISGLLPSAPKLNTTFNGLSGGGQSQTDNGKAAKAAETAAKKAEQEWERLGKKADQVSEQIAQEWVNTTQGQVAQTEAWYQKQTTTLNESAAANENYQLDLTRLNETYSRKRIKALYEEQKEANDIWDRAYELRKESQDKLAKLNLPTMVNSDGGIETSRVASSKNDIEVDYSDQITKIKNKYRDLQEAYNSASAQQQETDRNAWTENGLQFEISQEGILSFKKQSDKEQTIAEQEKIAKLRELNSDYITWKENLDSAYNSGNLTEYQNLLNSKQSLQQQELKGQQAMADTYETIWNEANKSTTEIMADAISSFNSGMQSVFKDMISGVDGAKSAWVGFRDTVIDIIADIYAKQMSANLTSSLMSWLPGISTPSFELPGVSVSAATGGAIYGPGTGTSDSIMARLSNGEYVIKASSVKQFGAGFFDTLNNGRMPAFATGGLVTGASLSSVGNSYSSASTGQSNGGNETPNIRVNINNYGSANVQAEKPQYDAQSKSYILTVMVDGLKNNSSVRSAAKGVMK